MIETVDQRLSEWIAGVLSEDIEVSLLPPGNIEKQRAVGLYLMDLLPSAPTRSNRRPLLQVLLRYLVTVQAESPMEAHRILGRLLFAAMEHAEYEVDLESIPAQTWRAFGTPPLPAFMLRLPLRVERPEKPAGLIRSPIEVNQSPLAALEGVVMGPDEIPLANARVALSTHNLVARTDRKGSFVFPAVPTMPSIKKFHVMARGRELFEEIDLLKMKQKTVVIHFNILEV